MEQVHVLHCVLLLFEAASGLKVNLGKNTIVRVGDCLSLEMASILGYKVEKLPLKFLGLSLGAKYKAKEIWNPMIVKFEKGLYLFKGGKLSMLKIILSNLLMYLLSLFSPPKKL